jgi:hypothetical protein
MVGKKHEGLAAVFKEADRTGDCVKNTVLTVRAQLWSTAMYEGIELEATASRGA